MAEPLPQFRYHPDPLATGSVKADADTPCLSCNRIRGYVYTGPAYTERNFILTHHVCPWCIADGSAARRFGATFSDAGAMEDVTGEAMAEVEQRTPGFEGWQQEVWLGHCGDAAAFLGTAGAKEIAEYGPQADAAVRKHLRDEFDLHGAELKEFFDSLQKAGEPTAYIFRCLHCREYLAYVDRV
jgi:uncharacterized protein CbrC (UPF0167 family)